MMNYKLDWTQNKTNDPKARGEEPEVKKFFQPYKMATQAYSNEALPEDNYFNEESINEHFGGRHLPKIKEVSETGGLDSAWNSERSIMVGVPHIYRSDAYIQKTLIVDRDQPDVLRMHTFNQDGMTIPKVSTGESASSNYNPERLPPTREIHDKLTKEVQTDPLDIDQRKMSKTESKAIPTKKESPQSKKLFSHLENTLKNSGKDVFKKVSAKNVKSPRMMTKNLLNSIPLKSVASKNTKPESPRESVDTHSNIAIKSATIVKRMKSLEMMPRGEMKRELESTMRNRPSVTQHSLQLGKSQGEISVKPSKTRIEFRSSDKTHVEGSVERFPFKVNKPSPQKLKLSKAKTGLLRGMCSKGDEKQKAFGGQGINSISFGTQDDHDDSFIPSSVDHNRSNSKMGLKTPVISSGQCQNRKALATNLMYFCLTKGLQSLAQKC